VRRYPRSQPPKPPPDDLAAAKVHPSSSVPGPYAAPIVVEPKPVPAELAKALISSFLGRGRDLEALATALRACSPAERALLGAAVPFGTGITAGRCDQLRALFAGIAAEPAPKAKEA
jgi:hypothetical protein